MIPNRKLQLRAGPALLCLHGAEGAPARSKGRAVQKKGIKGGAWWLHKAEKFDAQLTNRTWRSWGEAGRVSEDECVS